jgi:hypothetical protein
MEDLDDITDEYDKEFISLMITIEKKSENLNKHDKLRIKNWCKKLCQVTNNIEWKKNRNLHAICILDAILNEKFEEPYNKFPPEGSVPILNKALVKSKLTKKFYEETIRMQNEEQQQQEQQIEEENKNFNMNNNNNQSISKKKFRNQNKNSLKQYNNNNMDYNDKSNEIINEQQKEIERLNQALKEKDFEISNLIKEKGQMQKHIEELEQMIGKFMEAERAEE